MKRIPVGILIVALIALASWYLWPIEESSPGLQITGNIEMTEVRVAFKTPGQIAELTVQEGDRVERGQLLARLDEAELLRQREESEAGVRTATSRVRELRAQRDFQRENLAGVIGERESAVAVQQAILKELMSGSRRQEIEDAEASLQRARSNLRRAESDFQRAQPLRKSEDISAQEFDRIESTFQTAQADVRRGEQRLDLLKEGPRKETIDAARSRVRQAEAQLRTARSGSLEIERLNRAIETAESEVERTRARVQQIETRLGDTRATAAVAGVVLVKHAEPGEVVGAGSPIVTLADTARPWVRGYIPETLLGRLSLGSNVDVTTDSFPNRVYQGTVTFIASEAEFTPRQVLTPEQRSRLVYRIKITLENPNGELKLNMPIDARLELSPPDARSST